jgi:hypothetical protein
VRPRIEASLATLTGECDEAIDEIVAGMQPREHCRTRKDEPYVLLTVLRRAFVRAYREE